MLVMVTPGESEFTINKIYQGQLYSPMTVDGKETILAAADTITDYTYDAVYCSDLYTTQEALEYISKKIKGNPPITLVEELRERSGGSYEGMTYAAIRKGKSPKQYRAWERDPFEAPLYGESIQDVQDRLKPWSNNIMTKLMRNDNILIISHQDTIKALIAMVRGDDLLDVMSVKIEAGVPYFYYGTPKI